MSTIAILGGTGAEGFGLALRWARAGESVVIGSRDAARAKEAAAKIQAMLGGKANISGEENIAACGAARTACPDHTVRGPLPPAQANQNGDPSRQHPD